MDMNLLDAKINESGLKREYIASQIGLTRFGFREKLIYPHRWKVSEMSKLVSLLNLSTDEIKQIFDL